MNFQWLFYTQTQIWMFKKKSPGFKMGKLWIRPEYNSNWCSKWLLFVLGLLNKFFAQYLCVFPKCMVARWMHLPQTKHPRCNLFYILIVVRKHIQDSPSRFRAIPKPVLTVHIWWLWKLRWILFQHIIIPINA